MRPRHLIVWLLRAGWLVLPVTVGFAVAGAMDGRTETASIVVLVAAWGTWAVGLIATLVLSVPSLTAVRLLAPLTVAAAMVSALTGAGVAPTALAVVGAGVVAVLSFTAEVGEAFVQGSAYGDERRFPVRVPAALLAGPLPLAWLLLAGTAMGGVLLLAASTWVVGAVVLATAIGLGALLVPRFHRLTTRFVVLVPAGFVVHDSLVVAQTSMFRRPEVASLGLALADTQALDLTGTTLGNAVEVSLRRPGQVVVAGRREHPQGQAVSLQRFLVAPSRPGRLLTEAVNRGYSVTS